MFDKDYIPNVAERTVLNQMRRFPTLYRNSTRFFHSCIVGNCGGFEWKKGVLVCTDKKYVPPKDGSRNGKWVPYPFRISENFELFLSFISISTSLSPQLIFSLETEMSVKSIKASPTPKSKNRSVSI